MAHNFVQSSLINITCNASLTYEVLCFLIAPGTERKNPEYLLTCFKPCHFYWLYMILWFHLKWFKIFSYFRKSAHRQIVNIANFCKVDHWTWKTTGKYILQRIHSKLLEMLLASFVIQYRVSQLYNYQIWKLSTKYNKCTIDKETGSKDVTLFREHIRLSLPIILDTRGVTFWITLTEVFVDECHRIIDCIFETNQPNQMWFPSYCSNLIVHYFPACYFDH